MGPESQTLKYKAFISYRHSAIGREHAKSLELALKKYAKPTLKPPIKIFRDEQHMVPGNDLSKLIKDGLKNSEYLIFIAEKESSDSKWCQDELEYWCQDLKKSKNLIIVRVKNTINLNLQTNQIDWSKTDALPHLLKSYITRIPLYIDLEWANQKHLRTLEEEKYRGIINTLSAKFRGISPEMMNGEAVLAYRKNIRLRNIALSTLGLLLILSIVLGGYAFNQKNEAVKQKNVADNAKVVAEIQRDSARFQKKIAIEARIDAENSLKKYKIEEFQRCFRDGKIYFEAEVYELANKEFQVAEGITEDNRFNNSMVIKSKIPQLIQYLETCSKYIN